ncbi:MAG: ABC transporter permease subunit [Gemmataceae bacterium]|nr:ABC transporter permease subunit [Gemmataceae bacterium]
MGVQTDSLLRYRPWRGTPRGPLWGAAAVARVAVRLLAGRRLFWGLAALGLMVFFFFFYAQYLFVWIKTFTDETVRFAGVPVAVADLSKFLGRVNLDGSVHTFGNYVWFQGYILVIVLALAGSVLVGNDFAHGSLPFYLSKPIARRHYLLGKVLAVGAVVNLFTTLPAVVLWVQAGLLFDWHTYYVDNFHLLVGILGYGLLLTVTLGLLTVATAVWVRRTVPMVMAWVGPFVLLRMIAEWVVDGLKYDPRWRLIDLWNDLYLCGLWCLGADPRTIRPPAQPDVWEAALVVAGVCGGCLLYLRRRVQAVEIVQ